MASSTKIVEETTADSGEGRSSRAGRMSRRALLGLGALGTAAKAEAQVRTPRRSRPDTVPTAELRLLRRVTQGATTEDVAWLSSLGYYGYLEWQLNPETMGDPECESRLLAFPTIGLAPISLYGLPDSAVVIRQLTEATITRAIYSNRQLFERMVEFWTDHFHTNITSVGIFKTLEDRDVYRRNALSTFPAMLNASASSPAMLDVSEQHAERRAPREGAEPELRARAHGAAHARRRRRLHAAGRRRGGALLHRLAHALQHRRPARRHVLLRCEPARQQQQARARRTDCRRRRVQRRPQRPAHSRDAPELRALHREEAAALAARPTIRPRRSSPTSPASSRARPATSSRSCGASCTTTTCSGRRRSSSVRSTTSSRRCA